MICPQFFKNKWHPWKNSWAIFQKNFENWVIWVLNPEQWTLVPRALKSQSFKFFNTRNAGKAGLGRFQRLPYSHGPGRHCQQRDHRTLWPRVRLSPAHRVAHPVRGRLHLYPRWDANVKMSKRLRCTPFVTAFRANPMVKFACFIFRRMEYGELNCHYILWDRVSDIYPI